MEELIEGVLEFFNQLRRCFPADSVDANSHRIIFTAIVAAYGTDSGEPSATMNTISVGDDPITKLKKNRHLVGQQSIRQPRSSPFLLLQPVPTS